MLCGSGVYIIEWQERCRHAYEDMSQAEREPWCRNKNKRNNDWKPSENKSSAMKLEENGNDDIT